MPMSLQCIITLINALPSVMYLIITIKLITVYRKIRDLGRMQVKCSNLHKVFTSRELLLIYRQVNRVVDSRAET